MTNEELVTEFYGPTRALGWHFADNGGRHDHDEWISFACFELWRAVLLFDRRSTPEDEQKYAFWGFAKLYITRRMIDRLRGDTQRGKIKLAQHGLLGANPRVTSSVKETSVREELDGSRAEVRRVVHAMRAPDVFQQIDARLTLSSCERFLTRRQRDFVEAYLAGGDQESDGPAAGFSVGNYKWHKFSTVQRLREVLA